jgi:hypothetical protein
LTAQPSRRPTNPRAARRPKAAKATVGETPQAAQTVDEVTDPTAQDGDAPGSMANVVVEPATVDESEIHLGSMLFDQDWYRVEYPDVGAAGLDPIRHYFDNGAAEGRNPNRYFVTTWYLSAYADVVASRMNPFLHYLLYGAKEGRKPNG